MSRSTKSEQIKIAREQMDRISTKQQKMNEFLTDSLIEGPEPEPFPYIYHIIEVLKECEFIESK
jgi:hypothetical protein